MRILFVLATYYPHIGGVEYVVKSIAERLAKMGHEVTVIAGEPGAERPVEEEVNGVSVIRWPTWSPGDAYHVPKLKNKLEERLTKLVGDVDVIHIHSVHVVLSVWAGLKARSLGFRGRLVVTPYYHGTGHTAFSLSVYKRDHQKFCCLFISRSIAFDNSTAGYVSGGASKLYDELHIADIRKFNPTCY